jgi:hypothetical protein
MSQLIDNLQNKIKNNENALGYVAQETPKTQADIEMFSPTCVKLDSDIVSLVSQINSLKSQIVVLSTNAFAVGCGTTAGVTNIFPDSIVAKTPNYSTSTYDGNDPYGNTNNTLTASNAGIGSFVVYTQSDTSQTGIGSLFGTIGSCFRTPCTSSVCVSHASSITTLQNQISALQSQVTNLVTKTNAVKGERSEYEIARYGQNKTTRLLTDKNTQISIAIQAIKDTSPTA